MFGSDMDKMAGDATHAHSNANTNAHANANANANELQSAGALPNGRYEIWSSGEDCIGQGWININGIKANKSFLRFANRNDAMAVHKNLSELVGPWFLKSHFILHDDKFKNGHWLVVDKIDYSLDSYKTKKPDIWINSQTSRAPQLRSNYQDIIRDIITGMCKLHEQEFTHGMLSTTDIMIVNGSAKLGLIRNKPLKDQSSTFTEPFVSNDFRDLENVFLNILGNRRHHKELKHFHQSARVNNWQSLAKLYFHPILMYPAERFFLPIKTHIKYVYGKRNNQAYEILFGKKNKWISKVRKYSRQEPGYMRVQQHEDRKPYIDDGRGQFDFVRNSIVHINQKLSPPRKKEEDEVECDLSMMFPDFFTRLYDYFGKDDMEK